MVSVRLKLQYIEFVDDWPTIPENPQPPGNLYP